MTSIQYSELEIGEQIGGGGFAVVNKGQWKGQTVAIKSLFDPRMTQKAKTFFLNELNVHKNLEHENIVTFIAASTKPPKLCIVMGLCETNLDSALHDQELDIRFDEVGKLNLMLQISTAMQYLHTAEPMVIHRDLKPQNVLLASSSLGSSYTAKLCDFGLVSTKEISAGTPAYMAPELFGENPVLTKYVDVYAYSIVIWELITEQIPLSHLQAKEIKEYVLEGNRPEVPYSGAPHVVLELMKKCWAENPRSRPEFEKITKALAKICQCFSDKEAPKSPKSQEYSHTDTTQSSKANNREQKYEEGKF